MARFINDSSFNVLYISSVEKTYNFYKELGAKILEKDEDKVVAKLGDFNFHFIKDTSEPFDEYLHATRKEGRGQGSLFYIEVEDLMEFYFELKNSALGATTSIFVNNWNGEEFLLEDPDGYKLVFYKIK